jgi:purine-binding chemotaxis protein CheW
MAAVDHTADLPGVAAVHDESQLAKRVQLIIFRLGSEEYGLTIDQIKEVVLTPAIAQVPGMPAYIKGVANIRGNIIAILDLEERFQLGESKTESSGMAGNYTLVIESSRFKVGILVKEVPNTLSITTDKIEDSTAFIQYSSIDEKCITGIVKAGERLIILIDVFKLMDIENITNQATSNKTIQ